MCPGYNFKSLEQIAPFLEPSGSGITSLWARTTALKYNCTVTVGYPEKVDPTPQWPTSPEYYNSVIAVNGDGETVANYRKTHLYYTDETWALEGDEGFFEGFIPGLGDTSMGICMDLNPYKFEAPWTAFEFAFHVLECQSNLVIVTMAWMTREDGRMFSRMPNEPDMDTLTYWVTRLEPLIRAEKDEELIVVFCNRTGIEGEAVYAGTSAVIGVQDGEVKVYGVLGRGEKELLVVDTENPPYAKLIYRPETSVSEAHSELQRAVPPVSPPADKKSAKEPEQGAGGSSSTNTKASKVPSREPTPAAKQERQRPSIQIPSYESSTSANNSATTAKSTSSDVPTPSAPSPTPSSLRPKLTIPQSPPITWQNSPAVPMSAQSSYSIHSIHSVHSVRSTTSIKSNERPPEDSTPYPHSGVPLSGYPRKKIYGGNVTISHNQPFTPITPFEDASPMATRQHWPNSAVGLTPVDFAQDDAFGSSPPRRRRAFQDWPQLKPRTDQPVPKPTEPQAQQSAQSVVSSAASLGKLAGVSAEKSQQTAQPAAPQNSQRTATPRLIDVDPPGYGLGRNSPRPTPSADETKTADAEHPSSDDNSQHPARPSSPKSRNASRTGVRDRSDSSMGYHDPTIDIEQLLESITQRAESVNKNRGADSPYPTSSTPANARASSRTRAADSGTSIVIGANASIYGTDPSRTPARPLSRLAQHGRSTSISKEQQPGAERSRTPLGGDQTSRGVSRGRRPITHVAFATQGQFESPSDSPSSSGKESRDRNRRGSATRRTSQNHTADFEIIESIVCPNCPVHSRPPNEPSRNSGSGSEDQPMPSPPVAAATPSPSKTTDHELERSASLDSRASGLDSQADTIDNTGGTPSTPEFDPRTPKAMVFLRDTDDLIEMDRPGSKSPLDKMHTRIEMNEEIIL
ncbi:N-terminal amidase [Plectosphaerella plurivora]|uniref:N-terminal amidase n=1 Tax=Plectosphaerella plurivora TaxID=936078 RepID=A0A9P8VBM6_9PEZI|nr:N-terminal amidase [Plectosphaerella plurivora]